MEGHVLGTQDTDSSDMALSIGPNETLLAKPQNSAQKPLGIQNSPQAMPVARMETSDDLVATRTAPEQVRDSASRTLFQASMSLTKRKDITEQLRETTDKVLDVAKAIQSEVDPLRKEELKQEAAALIDEAKTQYEAAVKEDPSLAEDETYAAIMKPGADANDSRKTVQITLSAAPSVATVRLDGLSFEDAQIATTITQLESTVAGLSSQIVSQQSTATSIGAVVKSRISESSAEQAAKNTQSPEQQAEKLAGEIKKSYSAETLPPVERLNIESLLAAAEAASAEPRPARERISERPAADDNYLTKAIDPTKDGGAPTTAVKLLQS